MPPRSTRARYVVAATLRIAGLLLAASVGAAACNGDDGEPDSVIGEWELVSIDDDPLPAQMFENEASRAVMLDGWLSIRPGNVYLASYVVEDSSSAGIDTLEIEDEGEWGRSGRDVWLSLELLGQTYVDSLRYEGGLLRNDGAFGQYLYARQEDD